MKSVPRSEDVCTYSISQCTFLSVCEYAKVFLRFPVLRDIVLTLTGLLNQWKLCNAICFDCMDLCVRVKYKIIIHVHTYLSDGELCKFVFVRKHVHILIQSLTKKYVCWLYFLFLKRKVKT